MKRTITLLLLALSIAGYAIIQYFVFDVNQSGLIADKLEEGSLPIHWYILLYIHIISSVAALVLGPIAFLDRLKWKRKQLHKVVGKMYMGGVAFGGLSGFFMSFTATGGLISSLGFGSLAVLWMFSAVKAFRFIKQGEVAAHRRWMIRNYALTFAAVTLRIWMPLFMMIFGEDAFTACYIVVAWLCWMPNLLFAELYIQRKPTPMVKG